MSIDSPNYMDNIQINDLLRHVTPFVPRVPPPMALSVLREKYIDFARRTRILCCAITQDYQAGVPDYYLEAPKDHEIYTIIGIPNRGWNNTYTWRQPFDVIDNNCIRLHNAPTVDSVNGLCIYVTLLPSSCINTMPKSIATPFGQKIARGAVAELLCIPGKDWTNAGLARKYELDYERMLLSARAVSSSNRKVDNNSFKPVRIL